MTVQYKEDFIYLAGELLLGDNDNVSSFVITLEGNVLIKESL